MDDLRIPDGVRLMPLDGHVHLMLGDAGSYVRVALTRVDALDLAAALTRAAASPEVARG